MKVFKGLLLILAATVFSYLVTSFLIFIVCFAFGLEFSWLYALGIWAILALLEKCLIEERNKDGEENG